uniref:Endoplasmic reticulum lectin 1 n=1 Tax=Plectus sambesii TaxID=2011161 RepID=A0A914VXM6_9BILA
MSDRTAEEDAAFDQLNPPKRKVDDQLLPYYPVRYTQGTVCDITGKPRQTTVHYVCIVDAKNQVYSLDEVSSCEYEVVVLTNRLCTHPSFEPDVPEEHDIACVPLDEAGVKPTALIAWEKEQEWDYQQQFSVQIPGVNKPVRDTEDADDGTEEVEPKRSASRPQESPVPKAPTPPPPVDQQLATSFLSGDYCLYGGAGWWKHEYCHGKQVLQFHEDPHAGRTEIVLGKWDKDVHLKWMRENPHKAPIRADGRIRQVSHLYVNGDYCESSGLPRTVEVRLRCRESQGNQNAVTLYLLEPQVCEYVLGVESAMLCDLLQSAGDDGLLSQS